jgi:hypothetical protein
MALTLLAIDMHPHELSPLRTTNLAMPARHSSTGGIRPPRPGHDTSMPTPDSGKADVPDVGRCASADAQLRIGGADVDCAAAPCPAAANLDPASAGLLRHRDRDR